MRSEPVPSPFRERVRERVLFRPAPIPSGRPMPNDDGAVFAYEKLGSRNDDGGLAPVVFAA
jgi:hypothetical protein